MTSLFEGPRRNRQPVEAKVDLRRAHRGQMLKIVGARQGQDNEIRHIHVSPKRSKRETLSSSLE